MKSENVTIDFIVFAKSNICKIDFLNYVRVFIIQYIIQIQYKGNINI